MKRNICCVSIVLLLIIMSWNRIEMIYRNFAVNRAGTMAMVLNAGKDEILFYGSPVYGYLGMQIEDIMDEWGLPFDYSEGGGLNWCSYLGIDFYFDYQREVYNVVLDTVNCTYNGGMLNKNRERLIELFGEPSSEGWETGSSWEIGNGWKTGEVYRMNYMDFDKNINVGFWLTSPDERAYEITIW